MTVTYAAANSKSGSPIGSLVLLVALAAVFYLVAIRPGRRRVQAMQTAQNKLEAGREVVTTAGLYATVVALDEGGETVTLEIAPGVQARFARGAVMKVVEPAPDATDQR